MSVPRDVLGWVARAEEDFLLARSCLRRVTPLTVGACFHAQQCAEKYLKALLLARRQPFPRTHDLGALDALWTAAGRLLVSWSLSTRMIWTCCQPMLSKCAIRVPIQLRQGLSTPSPRHATCAASPDDLSVYANPGEEGRRWD